MKLHTSEEPKEPNNFRKILLMLIAIIVSFQAGIYAYANHRSFLSSAINNLYSEVRLYQANPLETIYLDIPYDSLVSIHDKRDQALETGILVTSDEDYVPASLRLDESGSSIKIKLRLKGDWVDHLGGDKWSFRIHINEDDESLFGMQRFSIQAPETRNYLHEWGYHQHLIQEGVLTTRYHFVNVVLNGELKGIYALEESFTQDLLESQGRREGIIFRLNEDLFWEISSRYYGSFVADATTPLAYLEYLMRFEESIAAQEMTAYREKRISADSILTAEKDTAFDLLNTFAYGNIDGGQILDEEAWGKFFAISDLWAASHAERWHNLRFYYNPITGNIEPIAFDGEPFELLYKAPIFLMDSEMAERIFFNNPGVQKAYFQTLERITAPSYLASLENVYGEEMEMYLTYLKREYWQGNLSIELPWDKLDVRGELLRINIDPIQFVRGGYALSSFDNEDWIELDIINLVSVPIQIEEIIIGDKVFNVEPSWCIHDRCSMQVDFIEQSLVLESGLANDYTPIPFRIPLRDLGMTLSDVESLKITAKINGLSKSVTTPIAQQKLPGSSVVSPVPQVSLDESLDPHEFLVKGPSNLLNVLEGDWLVKEDIIVPKGYRLNIHGGTKLRFKQGSALISFGPLGFFGDEENPILLTAEEDTWSGVVVLEAGEESIWEYVKIEKTSAIERDGWILTGGVTFYKSPIIITSSVFESAYAEDALNVVNTEFFLDRVEFSNASSDGFDGDFTVGEVIHSSFHDIVGDGVDFSGSEILISDSTFVNIQDKAISVGENSTVEVNEVTIHKVGIGLASKDLSFVTISDSKINQAELIGIAAYIKKPQFGPAKIIAKNLTIENTEKPVLNQTESRIELNGVLIEEEEFDVDLLYTTNLIE